MEDYKCRTYQGRVCQSRRGTLCLTTSSLFHYTKGSNSYFRNLRRGTRKLGNEVPSVGFSVPLGVHHSTSPWILLLISDNGSRSSSNDRYTQTIELYLGDQDQFSSRLTPRSFVHRRRNILYSSVLTGRFDEDLMTGECLFILYYLIMM